MNSLGHSSSNSVNNSAMSNYRQGQHNSSGNSSGNFQVACPLNCPCCMNYQLGKSCSCLVSRHTVGTQTDGLDFLRLNSSTEAYWTRGTFAHTMLQKYINRVIEDYNLKSQKDLTFGRAVMDIITNFPDLGFSTDVKAKVSNRMGKAIRWRKFSNKRAMKSADNSMATVPETQLPGPSTREPESSSTILEPVLQTSGPSNKANTVTPSHQEEFSDSDDELFLAALVKPRSATSPTSPKGKGKGKGKAKENQRLD